MNKEYTDTELKNLSNEQIKKLFLEVRSRLLINCRNEIIDNKDIEVYLCYITREIEKRNSL